MTVSPDAPRLVFDNLADAVRALRESGLRLSTARRLVLEALFAAEGPVSAQHLAHTLSIDESSVYRNLEILERQGLLRHIHLGHGPGLYALVARDEVEYLYCERCAKVTPVEPDQLTPVREHLKNRLGYEARFTHFALVGICEKCAARPHPQPDQPGNEPPADELHSHGDHVHSHPHVHTDIARQHQH